MGDIHWLAVGLSTVAAFIVGAIWYGALFGQSWKKELGVVSDLREEPPVWMLFGGNFLLLLASAFMLGHMFARNGVDRTEIFLMMSGGVALFFVLPALWINYLYQQKSIKLAMIDGGHWIAAYLAMGAVFALMG